MKIIVVFLIAVSCVFNTVIVFADSKAPPPDLEKRIEELIRQLGDESFEKRAKATEELKKIGKPALPFLEKAAADNPDIRVRAKAIIKAINEPSPKEQPGVVESGLGQLGEMGKMLGGLGGMGGGGGGDEGVGGMLGQLLGGIAGGGGGGGGLGDLGGMGGILGQLLGGMGGGGLGALMGMGGGQSGPQFVLMPPTTIKADDDRRYKFSHKVVILVEVTEVKDGKEVKRTVIANDEDDLKQKDPEAHKIYSKLIRAQMGGH